MRASSSVREVLNRCSCLFCACLIALSSVAAFADEQRGPTSRNWLILLGAKDEHVHELIDGGFDLNTRDEKGRTPLFALADAHGQAYDVLGEEGNLEHDVERAELLLELGAEVMIRDVNGKTPLHVAAHRGATAAFIEVLIGAGAKVDAQDESGSTPLHWAAREGRVDAVRTLLDHGADGGIENALGKTPFEMVERSHPERELKEGEVYWRLSDARFE